MPAPKYSGNCSWEIQSGSRSGIENGSGLAFYEIRYRGKTDDSGSFRTQWKRGAQCPIPGFGHLYLIDGPTINDEVGGASNATLRFEGPDINGEFGQDEDTVEWFNEKRSVLLNNYSEGKSGDGIYTYNASIAVVNYTQDSRRSEPKSPPALVDPTLLALEESGAYAVQPEEMGDEAWKVETISGFTRIVKNSDNSYSHQEWHEKIITGIPFVDQEV